MEFRILSCDFEKSIYIDPEFADVFDELPGEFSISYGDLKKFFNDEDYQAYDKENKILSLNRSDDFLEYFEFWENCREFGLPSGSGWINELPWTVDFVKFFNLISKEIETFNLKKIK